jgi:hypothetical protein
LEEAFFIRALPDPRVPAPLEEDLPKVRNDVVKHLTNGSSKSFVKLLGKYNLFNHQRDLLLWKNGSGVVLES